MSKGGHVDGEEENRIEYDTKTGEQTITADNGEIIATIDPVAERRLVWKFDLRILPVLAVMYLFNSLDKR